MTKVTESCRALPLLTPVQLILTAPQPAPTQHQSMCWLTEAPSVTFKGHLTVHGQLSTAAQGEQCYLHQPLEPVSWRTSMWGAQLKTGDLLKYLSFRLFISISILLHTAKTLNRPFRQLSDHLSMFFSFSKISGNTLGVWQKYHTCYKKINTFYVWSHFCTVYIDFFISGFHFHHLV